MLTRSRIRHLGLGIARCRRRANVLVRSRSRPARSSRVGLNPAQPRQRQHSHSDRAQQNCHTQNSSHNSDCTAGTHSAHRAPSRFHTHLSVVTCQEERHIVGEMWRKRDFGIGPTLADRRACRRRFANTLGSRRHFLHRVFHVLEHTLRQSLQCAGVALPKRRRTRGKRFQNTHQVRPVGQRQHDYGTHPQLARSHHIRARINLGIVANLNLPRPHAFARQPVTGIKPRPQLRSRVPARSPTHQFLIALQCDRGPARPGRQTSLFHNFIEHDVESQVGGKFGRQTCRPRRKACPEFGKIALDGGCVLWFIGR